MQTLLLGRRPYCPANGCLIEIRPHCKEYLVEAKLLHTTVHYAVFVTGRLAIRKVVRERSKNGGLADAIVTENLDNCSLGREA